MQEGMQSPLTFLGVNPSLEVNEVSSGMNLPPWDGNTLENSQNPDSAFEVIGVLYERQMRLTPLRTHWGAIGFHYKCGFMGIKKIKETIAK